VPDDVYEQARAQFSDEELVKLSLAVVMINGWNRLCVGFRTQPALRPFPGESAAARREEHLAAE
jgi:hypothetical protein